MRSEIIRCDTCTKEHDAQYYLPAEWQTITGRGKYNEGDDQHFCSLKCLKDWVEKQMLVVSDNSSHMKCGEFKITKEDCERWRDL